MEVPEYLPDASLRGDLGHYLMTGELLELIPNREPFIKMMQDWTENFYNAKGSSHNHQAWDGGYMDHVREVMNIGVQLYHTLNLCRKLPFTLADALVVLFLHDIEKPFKVGKVLTKCQCKYGADCLCIFVQATKENRKKWRDDLIEEYGIELTAEQQNALRYVEGVPDSEYTPGERTMGELAAFCHMCDICSARLWHDKGRNVPLDTVQWE
jgi:hypothetical protein